MSSPELSSTPDGTPALLYCCWSQVSSRLRLKLALGTRIGSLGAAVEGTYREETHENPTEPPGKHPERRS
jgi:hypothetical protein